MILSNQVLISIRKKIINSEFKLNKKFEIFFDSNYKNLDIDRNLLFKQFFYSRLINNDNIVNIFDLVSVVETILEN